MNIKIDKENGVYVIREVYSDTVLETEEGNQLAISMRDNTIEMSVVGSKKMFRANLETGDIDLISMSND